MRCLENPLHIETTIVDVLRHRAAQQTNQVGYIFLADGEIEADQLSYGVLDCKARAIATSLQTLHAQGARALLLYPPGLEFITAFLGCLYAGVVAVPAYPPRKNQNGLRLQRIARDAQATFVLTTTALCTQVQRQLDIPKTEIPIQWIATDSLDASQSEHWWAPSLSDQTLALLQYTSGSTGHPKGVMITHANLLQNSFAIQQRFQNDAHSIGVSWLPPYHDMGLIGGILQPLAIGRLMVLMSPVSFLQKPVRWLQAISRYQATTSGGPNFAYDLCVQKITSNQCSDLDLRSWKIAFNGAEPVRAQTLETFAQKFQKYGFAKTAFFPCYGMAESTLMIAGGNVNTAPSTCSVEATSFQRQQVIPSSNNTTLTRKLVSSGQAVLDHNIVIVDPNDLKPCPPGQVGEIWVSGASVAQGYWQNPEETEQVFQATLANDVSTSFLRTGDLGFIQAGELYVTGRLRELIIIRGLNHYPKDIEWTTQSSHAALRADHGAAFSIEVENVERLVIVQEVERTFLRHLPTDEIVSAIRQAVSKYHQIQVYAIVLLKTGSIPKTSSGKIQRYICRTQFLAGTLEVADQWQELTMRDVDCNEAAKPDVTVDLLTLQQRSTDLLKKLNNTHSASPLIQSGWPVNSNGSYPEQTGQNIQDWIVNHLATVLRVPPETIEISEPFAAYGLDSATAISLATDLSTHLKLDLDPTIFWEHPNIEALSQYLEHHSQSKLQDKN